MEGMPPYEGPDPAVSEALRTMQDDRNHPESVAAMVETPGRTALFEGAAARSVDLDSIFAGAGEVADEDDDPDTPGPVGTPTRRVNPQPCATGTARTGPNTSTRSPAATISATPAHAGAS